MRKNFYLILVAVILSFSGLLPAFAQPAIPDSSDFGPVEADIPKGPENIPEVPTGEIGPAIVKPAVPGIPAEARQYVSDKDFVEIYCLMNKWKSGEFFSALDSLEKNLTPAVVTAEEIVGDLNVPDITAIRQEANSKLAAICNATTVEDANAGVDDFFAYGESVRSDYTRLRNEMSSKLNAKGVDLKERITAGLQPIIDEEKAKAETELKAFGDSLGAAAQTDLEVEVGAKEFSSEGAAQAYVQSRLKTIQSQIMSQIKARADVLAKEIEAKLRAKVDEIAGSEKAKYEAFAKVLSGLEKAINNDLAVGLGKYEQYKTQALAKRKTVFMEVIAKSVAKAQEDLEKELSRFEEARKENPTMITIEEVLSQMQADRQVLEAKVSVAIDNENETEFQTAIDEFRAKWENYRADLEKEFFNPKSICGKAQEQFAGAKIQIETGLQKVKAIQNKCQGSVSEECLKINSFSARFQTLTAKINDIKERISGIEKICQNPEVADPENLVTLLKKIQTDGLDLESYGKALDAEKTKIIADSMAKVCTQMLPQLRAAKVELQQNDLSEIEGNISRCKAKNTEECAIINKAAGELNQLKSKLDSFIKDATKAESLCASAKGEDEFMVLRDLADYLKSQGDDIKSLAKELKQKQAEKASKKIVCKAALSRLEIAKQEISKGISEAKTALADCKTKTDARCLKITANNANFSTITSKSENTLKKIANIKSQCDQAKDELPEQTFLAELEAVRADESEIKKLVQELKAEANKEWPDYINSGKTFKVVFDVSPSKFDDSNWTGNWKTDPMGTIKGGETYTLSYSSVSGWSAKGYNEGTKGVGTWIYKYGNPYNYELDLWGRIYKFDEAGNVYDPDYGFVGHLIK